MKRIRFERIMAVAFALIVALQLMAQGDAQVTVVKVKASKMSAPVECTVVVPAEYTDPECQDTQYPVLYLLHGHGGDHKAWISKKPELPDVASQYGVIIVCPDGRNSWYWDSPVNAESQFETFIATDLVTFIDNHFRTIPEAGMRAITGLSMGGHGALWLAIRHSDVFGVAGSMSGGVNIIPFPEKWEMKKLLGDYATNKEVWQKHTVINLVPTLKKDQLKIIFDCGSEDFFYKVNCDLHEALLKAGIPHDFISRPGTHNWTYWTNSLDYQMLFFSKAFEQEAE